MSYLAIESRRQCTVRMLQHCNDNLPHENTCLSRSGFPWTPSRRPDVNQLENALHSQHTENSLSCTRRTKCLMEGALRSASFPAVSWFWHLWYLDRSFWVRAWSSCTTVALLPSLSFECMKWNSTRNNLSMLFRILQHPRHTTGNQRRQIQQVRFECWPQAESFSFDRK